jgi:beta-N-acetylhexosaminidase
MPASLAQLCGQLLVCGLAGTELGASERRALAEGRRGGVVLFGRNVHPGTEGARGVLALSTAVRAAFAPEAGRPLVAVDQEGGRVVRIGPPALALPAMRRIGELEDLAFTARLAEAQARELAAMGFSMSFAPVADVHTRPENPVIGERAFATTPEGVARQAAAWAAGLGRGGVLACAKHFPGHGDTTVDSHLTLPRVERSRAELDRIELFPFRALAREPSVASMMVAHVVFPALDPERPASLSGAVSTRLLRDELGFEGVLFSDDLEMKAIQLPMGEAAVLAVGAGCDALLICHQESLVEEALAALVREAEGSPAFRARCEEAHRRFTALRARGTPEPAADPAALAHVLGDSGAIARELADRLVNKDSA